MAFEVLNQIYGTDFVKLISEKISPKEEININELDKKLISETSQLNNESYKNNNSTHTSNNSSKIGHGTHVPNEVEAVFKKIDNYLENFGDNKPKSITLKPYDWALIDLSLRNASDNLCSLHTHGWNNLTADVVIECQADRCYCHRFLDDPEIREIVKTVSNYLDAMVNKIPQSLPIDPETKQKLNNRFNYFFDEAFNLDTNPNLAIQVIRVAGKELYKTNYA